MWFSPTSVLKMSRLVKQTAWREEIVDPNAGTVARANNNKKRAFSFAVKKYKETRRQLEVQRN